MISSITATPQLFYLQKQSNVERLSLCNLKKKLIGKFGSGYISEYSGHSSDKCTITPHHAHYSQCVFPCVTLFYRIAALNINPSELTKSSKPFHYGISLAWCILDLETPFHFVVLVDALLLFHQLITGPEKIIL